MSALISLTHGSRQKCRCRISPTATLNVIALRSAGRSSVRVPDMGHLGAYLGSQEGISGLLNGLLGLSVTVGLNDPFLTHAYVLLTPFGAASYLKVVVDTLLPTRLLLRSIACFL